MILIEYHYDNPRLQDSNFNLILKFYMNEKMRILFNNLGRTDSSGIRLYFTKDLRQHELGVLTLNSFQSSLSSVIPPESENQKLTSICYPECTNVSTSTTFSFKKNFLSFWNFENFVFWCLIYKYNSFYYWLYSAETLIKFYIKFL